MRTTRGFTLLELLIVIAIIGILSAVVLASLNAAQNKGNDAAVESALHVISQQAAVDFYYNNKYAYNTTTATAWTCDQAPGAGCANTPVFTGNAAPGQTNQLFGATGDSQIASALNQAYSNAYNDGTNPTIVYATTITNNATYIVLAHLSDGSYWCVDGYGNQLKTTTVPGGSAAAPFYTNNSAHKYYACK